MPLPANVTTVTVLGTFLTPEGDPSTGTITFTPSSWLTNSGANVAIPNSPTTKTLGTAGNFSVLLPITDDADLSPSGWVYNVSEVVDGVSQNYNILLPGTVAVGGTVYLADLVPAAPAGPEYYSLASSLSIGTVTNVEAGGSATASITGLAPSQVLSLGIPVGVTGPQGTNGSLMEPSVQQFAADGSVLRNLPARVIGAEQLLKQAVWWIDSAHSSASGQAVTNLGWGGTALNAQLGSAGSADSNDPRYLDWDGENYVYLPGVASNFLSVPDEAALDITGDIDIRAQVALDDWTPSATQLILSKLNNTGDQRSYTVNIRTTGVVRLSWSTDGAGTVNADSTVAPTVADGAALWVRATLDVDNGASGYDVKFFTSSDGVTWTQLGTTVTGVGVTSIFASTTAVRLGQDFGTTVMAGKVHRAQILNGIGGTPVLDVDCSQIGVGSATSFTALTGQTVTVNRSTSGRKTVAVTHPLWLLGTDDYLEVADNGLIDFGATDSFTALVVHRPWGTQGTNDTLIAKKANTTNTTAGWSLSGGSSTALQGQGQVGDGSAGITAVSGSRTAGAVSLVAAVRNVATDDVIVYLNGTAGSAVTDTTTATLANSEVMRVGRLSGAGTEYADMEFVAGALWRRALTSSELTTITSYYQGRIG
jgi:hypothetical protein